MLKSRKWCTKERVPLDRKRGGMLKCLELGKVRLGGEFLMRGLELLWATDIIKCQARSGNATYSGRKLDSRGYETDKPGTIFASDPIFVGKAVYMQN